jgi:hypothetical protein
MLASGLSSHGLKYSVANASPIVTQSSGDEIRNVSGMTGYTQIPQVPGMES